jgi:Domain of unknown function (DUF4253)
MGAMSAGVLPEDGENLAFTIGLYGPGRRHPSQGRPVAWITDWTQTSAGTTWAELSEKASETGLRPFLLADMAGEPGRPWGMPGSDRDEVIGDSFDATAIDRLDAAAILAGYWSEDEETFAEDEEFRAMLAPFGPNFPGLAAAIAAELDPELMRRALYQYTRDARIGLVPARRPADVLARLGWQGAVNSRETAEITAVLRSWEDRFGARLLEVGFADIRLLVSRPPRTLEAALPIAAEQVAFGDEAHGGLRSVDEIAHAIVGNPFWDFWWD